MRFDVKPLKKKSLFFFPVIYHFVSLPYVLQDPGFWRVNKFRVASCHFHARYRIDVPAASILLKSLNVISVKVPRFSLNGWNVSGCRNPNTLQNSSEEAPSACCWCSHGTFVPCSASCGMPWCVPTAASPFREHETLGCLLHNRRKTPPKIPKSSSRQIHVALAIQSPSLTLFFFFPQRGAAMDFCLHELITSRLANAMWDHCCLCPGSRLPMRAVASGSALQFTGKEAQALGSVCRCNRCCVFPDQLLNPLFLNKDLSVCIVSHELACSRCEGKHLQLSQVSGSRFRLLSLLAGDWQLHSLRWERTIFKEVS